MPLDDLIKKHWGKPFLQDIIPTLWELFCGTLRLYFRKNLLKKMGWTDKDIEDFANKA